MKLFPSAKCSNRNKTSFAVLGLKANQIGSEEWYDLLAEIKPTGYSRNYR